MVLEERFDSRLVESPKFALVMAIAASSQSVEEVADAVEEATEDGASCTEFRVALLAEGKYSGAALPSIAVESRPRRALS